MRSPIANSCHYKMDSNTRVTYIFYVFTTLLAAMQCNSLPTIPNVLSQTRLELFVMQHQRQFTNTALTLERQIFDWRRHYQQRLEVIGYQAEFVERSIANLENDLVPMELLDDIHNYCVIRHQGQLQKFTKYKTELAACMQKGTSVVGPLANAAEATLNNLKAYYTNTFITALKTCKTAPNSNDTVLMACSVKAVNTTVLQTLTSTKTFDTQLKSSSCQAELKIREVSDCYNEVTSRVFQIIGAVKGLVENCVAGHEFCPTCTSDNAILDGVCPHQLSWNLAAGELSADTVRNPFKGLNAAAQCLQINFIDKRGRRK